MDANFVRFTTTQKKLAIPKQYSGMIPGKGRKLFRKKAESFEFQSQQILETFFEEF